MKPTIYRVLIGHSRAAPVQHSFRHGSYMWLFDLDHPPRMGRPWRWLAGYRAGDHLDVRAELDRAGIDADRIVVLTNLRVLGHVFNPISVYWAYDLHGALAAHVAEVHNTYGGRHAYVLPANHSPASLVSKAMYVSPFNPVDGNYRIRVSEPGPTLSVSVALERPGLPPFQASLHGHEVDTSRSGLLRQAARYPLAPLRGRVLIQYQGVRLWRKGMEVQPR